MDLIEFLLLFMFLFFYGELKIYKYKLQTKILQSDATVGSAFSKFKFNGSLLVFVYIRFQFLIFLKLNFLSHVKSSLWKVTFYL